MLIFLLLLGLIVQVQAQDRNVPTVAPRNPDVVGPERGTNAPIDRSCTSSDMILKCGLYGQIPSLCGPEEKPQCNQEVVIIPGRDITQPLSRYQLSCPSCISSEYAGYLCREKPSLECEENADPTLEFSLEKSSLCPTCFKIPTVEKCSRELAEACVSKLGNKELPVCAEREFPTLTDDCCFSCARALPTVPELTCFNRDLPDCDELTKEEIDRENLRELGDRDSNGCRLCAPPSPIRDIAKKCSISDFRTYRERAPECDAEERPLLNRNSTRCGPPCVRQASKKHLLEVIACRKNLPDCADDDRAKRSVFLPGKACPICEVKRPVCQCDDDQLCVRNKDGKHCVGKKRFFIRLKLHAVVRSQMRDISKEVMTKILKEMLERYCERNGEAERCGKYLDRTLDSISCIGKRNLADVEGSIELEIEVAGGEEEKLRGRRLLQDIPSRDDILNFVEDSLRDDTTYVNSTESSPPSDIPAERQCFVPENVLKCRLLGVEIPFCQQVRPVCERKEVRSVAGKYLMTCPSCIPLEYTDDLCKERVTTPCARGDNQEVRWTEEKKSLCPSCFKVPDISSPDECTWEKKRKCLTRLKYNNITRCVDREVAIQDDCCFSCRLAKEPKEDTCPVELPKCEALSIEKTDVREAAKILGERDDDGCRKCAPQGPLRNLGEKCSREDFRKYKELAPACAAGERGFSRKNSTRCGPPCIRQASKKHLLQVIACSRNLRECEDDDRKKRLIFLPDEACPICVPKRPKCSCEDGQVCIRDREGESKCVNKRRVVVRLKLKSIVKSEFNNTTKEVITRILKEMLERYCERNGEAERCEKHRDRILDSIKCTNKRAVVDGTIDIEIEVAEGADEEMGRRRLLQRDVPSRDDIVKLVEDSLKDDETYVDSTESSSPSDIPVDKQCFVPDHILKCKLAGISMEYCKETRPTCERKEVDTLAGKYLMVCPSCIPQEYTEDLCREKPERLCSETKDPIVQYEASKKSLCPSCFRIRFEDDCTWQKKRDCLAKLRSNNLTTCVNREVAIKDDCCFSCRLEKEPQEDKCTVELPECEDPENEKADMREMVKRLGERDENGCRKCAPQGPLRKRGEKCSRQDFLDYKKLAPTCSAREKGILEKESKRCGPACVRQASKKHLLQVIACSKDLPQCEDDDRTNRRIFLPDEACPICEPKRPKCSLSCTDAQVCVRDREGEAKCVGKKRLFMKLKLKAIVKKEIRQIEPNAMTRVLKEMLERYCERAGETERCEKHLDRILDSINCTKKRNVESLEDDDEVELTVDIAEASETGRRLLQIDEPTNLLTDAVMDDPTYVEGLNTEQNGVTSSPTVGGLKPEDPNQSSALFVSISFLLSMVGISQF